MSMASPQVQALARRLLAFEAGHDDAAEARGDVVVRVIEELRLRLIKFAGMDGFRALLTRALTLAKAEVPALSKVRVGVDGSLEAFVGIERSDEVVQAGTVLVAHVLQLLVTFIGEPLTLHLIRDTWPNAPVSGADLTEETP